MRLRLTSRAQIDIAELVEFGVEQFGEGHAGTYLDRIEERFRLLLEQPEIGRAEPELHHRARSFPSGSHRIYYSIDGDTITIRRILHKARDVARWME